MFTTHWTRVGMTWTFTMAQETFLELLVLDCRNMLPSSIILWNFNTTKYYKSRILQVAHNIFLKKHRQPQNLHRNILQIKDITNNIS